MLALQNQQLTVANNNKVKKYNAMPANNEHRSLGWPLAPPILMACSLGIHIYLDLMTIATFYS